MLWHMEHGEAEPGIREQMRINKMPAPRWLAEKPELLPGLEFYLKAFWELATCRSVGFGEGPIPWSAMSEYGRRHQIFGDEFDRFVLIMKHLDVKYLNYRNKKQGKLADKQVKQAKSNPRQKQPIGANKNGPSVR